MNKARHMVSFVEREKDVVWIDGGRRDGVDGGLEKV